MRSGTFVAVFLASAMPWGAVAELPSSRDGREFVEAFVVSERAKLVARVHREGNQFDAGRELEKLRQKHEKVFGTSISNEMLADFERIARDAALQSPDPALLNSETGKRKNPSEVYPELYLAGVKVKFLEDIREEGEKFDTAKEMAKVSERFERNFGSPVPAQFQSDLNRIAERARSVISQQREANSTSKEAAGRPADTAKVSRKSPVKIIRGVRYPPGLPEWFAAHDKDEDGQVALYEWERDKLDEFQEWDLNADGLLEPMEVLRRSQKLNPPKPAKK